LPALVVGALLAELAKLTVRSNWPFQVRRYRRESDHRQCEERCAWGATTVSEESQSADESQKRTEHDCERTAKATPPCALSNRVPWPLEPWLTFGGCVPGH
jgi:hypothetical protein